jgi:hypothetical protein
LWKKSGQQNRGTTDYADYTEKKGKVKGEKAKVWNPPEADG